MTFNLNQHTRASEHKDLSGRLRPSGRFSVTQVFRKRRVIPDVGKVFTKKIITMLLLQCENPEGGVMGAAFNFYLQGLLRYHPVAAVTLGSSNATNSESRAKRGSKGITPRQRDILCWGANTLERIYGRATLSFLTYTLPPLHPDDLNSVRENWSEVIDYTVKLIKAELEKNGINTAVVGCTEIQLERFQETGLQYPHLHLVFRGRLSTGADWAIEPRRFRSFWIRSVRRFLANPCGTWKASENVERVKKSVGGYLAKYISKCASKQIGMGAMSWHPSDWVIVSRRVRGLYERLSMGGYETGLMLLSVVSNWSGVEGYKRPIVIRTPYEYESEWKGEVKTYKGVDERKIGEYGWLKGYEVYPSYSEVHPYVQRCP
jgi:hypothetical protein